jgi:hypothetical protein
MTALVQEGLVEIFCKQCKLLIRYNFKEGLRTNAPTNKKFGVIKIYR